MSATRRSLAAAAVVAVGVSFALAVSGGWSALAAPAPPTGCAEVEVIAVRGTGEPGPVGSGLSGLAQAITNGTTKTVSTYGLPYPATSDWVNSANQGITLLAERITAQTSACPEQSLVLIGYSQGAWVIGDALAGGGGGVPPAVTPALGTKVAAIIFYGDPRFTAGEPYNVGSHTAGVSGIIPREVGGLSAYASRIQSFCDFDDEFCQNGATGDGHQRYWQTETANASAFVLSKLDATL